MGIFEKRVNQKLNELNQNIVIRKADFSWNDSSNTQRTFSLLLQHITSKVKNLISLDDQINQEISKLPTYYNLSKLQTVMNDMKVQFTELQNIYTQGQEGDYKLKLASLNVVLAKDMQTMVPQEVHNVLGHVKNVFELLKELKSDAQAAYQISTHLGDSEDERKVKWEAAYLSNITLQFMKSLAEVHNDKSFWIQNKPEPKVEKPVQPVAPQPQHTNQDPLGLFQDEPDHVNVNGDTFADVPDAASPRNPIQPAPVAPAPVAPKPPVAPAPVAPAPIAKPPQPNNAPKEIPKFDESNSKLIPVKPASLTEALGYSIRKPEGAKFDIGQEVRIGFMKVKVTGYKMGHLHRINYIVQARNGQYYEFEPYLGINPFERRR